MFPTWGNTNYWGYVFLGGEHILLGIRVSQMVEHILLGICVSQVGEHISLAIRVTVTSCVNIKEFLKDTTTADDHENVAWKNEFTFFQSLVIIPTRLFCQMQANSSGAEFLSTISKFMKRMNFVIACLRPSQNVK